MDGAEAKPAEGVKPTDHVELTVDRILLVGQCTSVDEESGQCVVSILGYPSTETRTRCTSDVTVRDRQWLGSAGLAAQW